ncbi:MAG TPA: SH3 domain-containing protein [Spirochaetia bacterium]|nr:SH3 domain-containing protein [Spirochaetia bacterium]
MRRLPAFLCAVLILSCSHSSNQRLMATVDLVPSATRVFMQSDSEPVVTSWLTLGMSYPAARASVLYGLIVSEAQALDAEHHPTGEALRRGAHVTIADASAWEPAGREYKRWYKASAQGSNRELWLESSKVALITTAQGALSGGFIERKIAIAGGESEYNILVLCHGTAVSLIDTSVLVFKDAFHPSGVTRVSLEDINSDGVPEAVVQAQTIVSLQYLGASPLAWEAWLREKDGSWEVIFRYNSGYGTDQGNSYSATRRAFSSSGAGFFDTVKVTTDLMETTAQGIFRNTIETFLLWNGSQYKEDPGKGLPQLGTITAEQAQLAALPTTDSPPVDKLARGDTLYVIDRGNVPQDVGGEQGFWFHAVSHSGKEGWIHSSSMSLSKLDHLKVNREAFLGKPAFSAPSSP